MRATANRRKAVTLILLLLGLALFEIFNFYTSKIALDSMLGSFGNVLFNAFTLGGILAAAAWTIDVGGILRIFTPETGGMKKEPRWVLYAFIFWLVASVFNTFLTWWVFELGLEGATRIPTALSGVESWVPIIAAGFVWLIRFALVNNIGTVGDDLFAMKFPKLGFKLPSLKKAPRGNLPPYSAPSFSSVRNLSNSPFSFDNNDEEELDEVGDNKWKFKDFRKALTANPRLSKKTPEELSAIANVAPRTIYRWLDKVA